MRRRTVLAMIAMVAAVAMFAAACGDDDDSGDAAATTPDGPTITLRGQDFSESVTIAEVYGQYLEAKGYDVEILTAAGFRTEAIDGLRNGDLNMIIDYIGGSQTELAPDEDTSADPAEVAAVITPLFADIGATVLDYSPAVDGDAFVVRGDTEGTTISDVADAGLVFGASSQCFERPQCFIGLTDPDLYGITFAGRKTLEFGPLLGEALKAEEVDAVVWNTTAPQITTEGFKVLEDDKGLFPAQNIAPIISTEVLDAYGEQLTTDLNELSAQITTEDLLAWNTETDINKVESDEVASDWLTEKGLE
ncbi:MAG: ABC transporter substrate-binding protein [Actinomycetota bacterium]